MAAERHVEVAAAVEPAEAVVPGAIEVVEERGRFGRLRLAAGQERVEAIARPVIRLLVLVERLRSTTSPRLSQR